MNVFNFLRLLCEEKILCFLNQMFDPFPPSKIPGSLLGTTEQIPISYTGTPEAEPTCGRPLGMRFDKYGINLIVADAYLGLLEVNPKARTVSTLVPPSPGMNNRPFRFVNDLDIARDRTIYFTDSSSKWQRRQFHYSILEGDNTGRLMAYHPKTGEMEVLMDGLHFANGVQISPDGDHVLVAETGALRIMK